MTNRTTRLADGRGIALVSVLLIVALLLAIGSFVSGAIRVELRIANNDLLAKKAFAHAEAGLDHAFRLIFDATDNGFDDELANDGTGGALSGMGNGEHRGGYRFVNYARGGADDGYYVRVLDDFDDGDQYTDTNSIVAVESLGQMNGARATVRSLLQVERSPRCAFTTCQATAALAGNLTIAGANGCAHSNQNLAIQGSSASFALPPTASGELDINANPTIEGASLSNQEKADYIRDHRRQPEHPIPRVNPLDFGYGAEGTGSNLAAAIEALRDGAGDPTGWLLDNSCVAVKPGAVPWNCASGNVANYCNGEAATGNQSFSCVNGCPQGRLPGWSCATPADGVPAARWTVSGSPPNGAYFIEGSADIGSVGSALAPWRATVVAMNSVNHSGSTTMEPFVASGALARLLIVSGNDIKLRGSFGAANEPGAILAHQQIDFAGNPTVNAFVLAEDGCRTWTGDPAPLTTSANNLAGQNLAEWTILDSLTGNTTIRYDGFNTPLLTRPPQRIGWQQHINR